MLTSRIFYGFSFVRGSFVSHNCTISVRFFSVTFYVRRKYNWNTEATLVRLRFEINLSSTRIMKRGARCLESFDPFSIQREIREDIYFSAPSTLHRRVSSDLTRLRKICFSMGSRIEFESKIVEIAEIVAIANHGQVVLRLIPW